MGGDWPSIHGSPRVAWMDQLAVNGFYIFCSPPHWGFFFTYCPPPSSGENIFFDILAPPHPWSLCSVCKISEKKISAPRVRGETRKMWQTNNQQTTNNKQATTNKQSSLYHFCIISWVEKTLALSPTRRGAPARPWGGAVSSSGKMASSSGKMVSSSGKNIFSYRLAPPQGGREHPIIRRIWPLLKKTSKIHYKKY